MSETKNQKPKSVDFIREIIAEDIKSGKHRQIITRFPPEPNGYLHIGHAKAICLSFGIAEEYAASGARCHLRFDDTNPAKEEVEYVESIKRDVEWLGFDWKEHLYFASDYFDYFYECAVVLIEKNLAYVDEQSPEDIKKQRGDVNTPGEFSPFRERPAAESLAAFSKMKAGDFANGGAVLRAKIDMASSNMNMRDPVLYRVMHQSHHNTGDTWCIYPMYDFAHPLEDAKEGITHSLCTLEFENHRPLYDWVIDNCPVPHVPRQIEFARLNLAYTVTSKRKSLELVRDGHVSGWDDPRMPTLSGLRRRGVPPQVIRALMTRLGITKQNSMTDLALLEFETRDYLNQIALRKMAVLDPLKVVVTNFPGGESEEVEIPNHPNNEADGKRLVNMTREVWIEREDFMVDAPNKYFRLKPGGYVRLRGSYILQYQDHDTDENGEVTEVRVEFIPDTIGKDAPEGIKCKAAIHWVSVSEGVEGEVRLYDRLFTAENPDKIEGGYVNGLNPDSLVVLKNAKFEPSLAEIAPGARVQFERIGYFVADEIDHTKESPVFNRIVTLRDSWGKMG